MMLLKPVAYSGQALQNGYTPDFHDPPCNELIKVTIVLFLP